MPQSEFPRFEVTQNLRALPPLHPHPVRVSVHLTKLTATLNVRTWAGSRLAVLASAEHRAERLDVVVCGLAASEPLLVRTGHSRGAQTMQGPCKAPNRRQTADDYGCSLSNVD